VKELEDAFTLMEVLQEHSLPLLQVRCIAAAATAAAALYSATLDASQFSMQARP
jgi:hypothetical protein